MKRKSISKRSRFKIFQRDMFTCQYCWKTPEKHDVTLEIDHQISVKDWWGNEEENLITSCFDCNRWKRWDSVIKTDIQETRNELEEIKERLDQVKFISKLRKDIKKKQNEIEEWKYSFVDDIMIDYEDDSIRKVKTRIKNQHIKYNYSLHILEECLIITDDKFSQKEYFYIDDFIRYFHWVLNKKTDNDIKDMKEFINNL